MIIVFKAIKTWVEFGARFFACLEWKKSELGWLAWIQVVADPEEAKKYEARTQ
jgi:hypothetical protein